MKNAIESNKEMTIISRQAVLEAIRDALLSEDNHNRYIGIVETVSDIYDDEDIIEDCISLDSE